MWQLFSPKRKKSTLIAQPGCEEKKKMTCNKSKRTRNWYRGIKMRISLKIKQLQALIWA